MKSERRPKTKTVEIMVPVREKWIVDKRFVEGNLEMALGRGLSYDETLAALDAHGGYLHNLARLGARIFIIRTGTFEGTHRIVLHTTSSLSYSEDFKKSHSKEDYQISFPQR